MRYRKLRMAWTVGCLTAFSLLAGLWVRSYWWHDLIPLNFGQPTVYAVRSANGRLTLSRSYDGNRSTGQILALRKDLATDDLAPYVWHTTQVSGRKRDALSTPIWILVLLSATVAAVSWARFAQRFSLRTLLIATTLVAVVLGLVMWAVRG
jgi:hypothetical protein